MSRVSSGMDARVSTNQSTSCHHIFQAMDFDLELFSNEQYVTCISLLLFEWVHRYRFRHASVMVSVFPKGNQAQSIGYQSNEHSLINISPSFQLTKTPRLKCLKADPLTKNLSKVFASYVSSFCTNVHMGAQQNPTVNISPPSYPLLNSPVQQKKEFTLFPASV